MSSGTSDNSQEELPIHRRKIINVSCFTSGMLNSRLVHNWPSHRILGRLTRLYVLYGQKYIPPIPEQLKKNNDVIHIVIRKSDEGKTVHIIIRCGCRTWLLLLGISSISSLKKPPKSLAQVCVLGFFSLIIYIKVIKTALLFQKDSFLSYWLVSWSSDNFWIILTRFCSVFYQCLVLYFELLAVIHRFVFLTERLQLINVNQWQNVV